MAADGHAEAADFADRLGHAVEEIGVVIDKPPCPPAAACLLVRKEGDDYVTGRAAAFCEPLPQHREDDRIHVLHVDRAAAPHAVVFKFTGERRDAPIGSIRGNHVEMAVDQQGRSARIRSLDPGHHAGPPIV